ncbi:ribokinase [Pseudolactococcus yaeyamensis]
MKNVTVIGSLAIDNIISTDVVPNSGETVLGRSFDITFGGKGANQVVALGRLGARPFMVGAVGKDSNGTSVIENLVNHQVNVDFVGTVPQPTGTAHIILFENDNRIIVVPSANHEMTVKNLKDDFWLLLKHSELVVLQHEIPQETNEAIIKYCDEHHVKVLLNPAPARKISEDLIDKITYLTPNEHELEIIFPHLTREAVLKKYPQKLIVTLGSKGVAYHDGKKEILVPAFKVKPVDTTGAGDTFNGAFAYALLNELEIESAIKFGNLAASISVQYFGAQGGMPTLEKMKGSEFYDKTWHI